MLYWIANNTITFIQQYIDHARRQGYKPDIFGNINSTFRRKPAETKPPETKQGGKPPAKK